jgi:hypothetical protein
MSRRIVDVIERGAEAFLTALLMIISLAVFWPIAFAHRRFMLRGVS